MAAQGPAPRAVDAVQHPAATGRAFSRVPDQQLDRARCLAIHRPRAHRAARAVLHAPAPGGAAQGPGGAGEQIELRQVRFRTVGDISCTCPVESRAATAADIVLETLAADMSERGATRMDDQTSEASMEKRKKDGYF